MPDLFRPDMVPIWGTVFGTLMIFGIVASVMWFKVREKELNVHQDMRIREMDHQRKMKELEVELEKAKAQQASGKATA